MREDALVAVFFRAVLGIVRPIAALDGNQFLAVQAEAIALNLREMARLKVPIVTIITGEGGSGGALAIAVSDRVLMMENAIYSVISPEGCASIGI